MNEGKFFTNKLESKKIKPESDVEQIKSMELDWKLSDDNHITSFNINWNHLCINYTTFSVKPATDGEIEYEEKKTWNLSRNELKINKNDEDYIIDRLLNMYSKEESAFLLNLYSQVINYQYSEGKLKKLIDNFLKNVRVVKNGRFFIVDMLGYPGPVILDMKNKDVIMLKDENSKIHHPKDMIEWEKEKSFAISGSDHRGGIKIFDASSGELINNIDPSSQVEGLMKSQNEKEIISWSFEKGGEKKIKIWNKDNLKITREFSCPSNFQITGEMVEIKDGKFLVFSDGKETFIISRDTGEVIKKILGNSPKYDFRGGISTLNDGTIEFWRFEGSLGKNHNIMIREGKILDNWQRFCEFDKESFSLKVGENIPDIFWIQSGNLEAKRLTEKKKFKWGKERLYFHIEEKDLFKLGKLIENIAGQNHIAIKFKYYDTEKNSRLENSATRFVANFASVADAKKLYEQLINNKEYKKMLAADNDNDYCSYQLDEKAYYAQGYREFRMDEIAEARKKSENIIKNSDGTYSIRIKTEEGDWNMTITEEEYDKMTNESFFAKKFKKIWDSGVSDNNNDDKTEKPSLKSSIKNAFSL